MTLAVLMLLAAPAIALPVLPEGDCFTAGFTQVRSLPMLAKPLALEGTLQIERDGDLEWRIESPYRYRFAAHGGMFTETLPDGTERTVDAAKAPWLAGMQQVFGALLAGKAGALTDWFRVENVAGVDGGQRLTLAPANDAVAGIVERLVIGYDDYLREVTVTESGGGSTEIRFEPLLACTGEAP